MSYPVAYKWDLPVAQPCDLLAVAPDGSVSFSYVPDRALMRERIKAFTLGMLEICGDGDDMPVKHTFKDGVYMRELFIKKGQLVVGKVHKRACMNIVASGDISIVTEHGAKRVQAGFTGVSEAGIQKVGIAHEDTVFINVFRTDVDDVDAIEADIAFNSYDEVPALALEMEG